MQKLNFLLRVKTENYIDYGFLSNNFIKLKYTEISYSKRQKKVHHLQNKFPFFLN